MLIMQLCQDTTPENQKFILQEVSERSPSFLAVLCALQRGAWRHRDAAMYRRRSQ